MLLVRHINMFFQFYDIEKDKGTIVMLDGKTVTPLYVQLMNQIEEKIRCGVYQPGERLQSESEMAKTFGVSIITVRSAVSGLVEKGLVEKKQGKGTFVSKPKFTKDMKNLQSFTEMCRYMGMEPGGKMLENCLASPDDKTRKLLGLEKDSQVISISRLRYADGQPVAIEKNYFPTKYAFLLDETFDNNSLFSFLHEKAKVTVSASEKWIGLCRATASEAKLLEVKKVPSCCLSRVSHTPRIMSLCMWEFRYLTVKTAHYIFISPTEYKKETKGEREKFSSD